MSRVNQPDTLVSELREIQRRLRLLEASAPRAVLRTSETTLGERFTSAQPGDWPGTESATWEAVLRTFAGRGPLRLIIETAADPGTRGRARITIDGVPVSREMTATDETGRDVVELAPESELNEIVVEALRESGTGTVRVTAFVLRP